MQSNDGVIYYQDANKCVGAINWLSLQTTYLMVAWIGGNNLKIFPRNLVISYTRGNTRDSYTRDKQEFSFFCK